MTTPRVGLALAADDGFRAASLPLFEEGVVDVVKYGRSTSRGRSGGSPTPEKWVSAVCDLRSTHGPPVQTARRRLLRALGDVGEAAGPLARELEARARAPSLRSYLRHAGIHVGPSAFSRRPAPSADDRRGRSRRTPPRFRRMGNIVGSPIGLENLAPVLGRRDADEQGEFLDALLWPQDGFLLLDLHNVYCQSTSPRHPHPRAPSARMPLARVREIHVSGGSFWPARLRPAAERPRRRTTAPAGQRSSTVHPVTRSR